MDRQKNSSRWYLLCLALLLCFAFLAVATGTAYARYRTDERKDITFEIREPLNTRIGTVVTDDEGNEKFDSDGELAWVVEEKTATLAMAVSNGVPADLEKGVPSDVSKESQRICFRLIGGLGLTVGEEAAKVTLTVAEGNSERTVEAKATKITEGTALYNEHGDGWIFTFFDENEKELFWVLDGGKFSYVKMTITIDITDINMGSVMLLPQVITETVD